MIFGKISPAIDPVHSLVNLVKFWKLLKIVEMMSTECIMVDLDGFQSLELLYMAKYAKISHFQLFSMHFI